MADQLHELLARASSGDGVARERAFEELLRLLMIFVRSSMGRAIRDHRESDDVCQSIARSFVEDHALGKVGFGSEAEVIGYLKTVVRTKMAELARHDRAGKRGGEASPFPLHEAIDQDLPPDADEGMDARTRELILRTVETLPDDDQELVRMRLAGLAWEQIASVRGGDPAALRKRWSRLLVELRARFEAN